MTYRDLGPLPCPRCGDPLAAFNEGRAKWRCKQCGGTLVGAEEIAVEIGERQFVRAVATPTIPCPLCREPMTPMEVGDYRVERCAAQGYVWFERGVLGSVRKSN
jgi:hypothetical protein